MAAHPPSGGTDDRLPLEAMPRGGQRVSRPRSPVRSHPRLFVPQGYEPGYAYPLLVWLPGTRGFDLGRAMNRVSTRNFVAVEPALPRRVAGRAVLDDAVWEAVDAAAERCHVHPDRVFLVGRGTGGTDAFRVAFRHAERFAGMVSLGGSFPHAEALFAKLAAVRRLPVLFCCRHDAADAMAATTALTLRLFHAAGAQLSMRIYRESHDLAAPILRDVNRWLMDEVCGGVAADERIGST